MKWLQQVFAGGVCLGMTACGPNATPTPKTETTDIATNADTIAVSNLLEPIQKYPDSVPLYNQLIDKLDNENNYKAAAEVAGRLAKRGNERRYNFWFIKADFYRKAKMYDSAIAAYLVFLKKYPDDEDRLLNLANTYAEAGNENAVALSNDIARRFPSREMRSRAFFIKGVYYNQVKQFAEARKWLDSTLLIDYNFYEAYMEKGYSQYDDKMYKQALQTFTTLTNLQEGYADGWYWVAKCQEALGNKASAVENYQTAFLLDSSIVEARQAVERLKSQ